MTDADLAAARGLIEDVVSENREWMEANRGRTLGDLRARLELTLAQCLPYVTAGDPPVADRAGLPVPLSEELALWPVAAEGNAAPRRFSDAGVRIAGYAWRVAALEHSAGTGCEINRLLDFTDSVEIDPA